MASGGQTVKQKQVSSAPDCSVQTFSLRGSHILFDRASRSARAIMLRFRTRSFHDIDCRCWRWTGNHWGGWPARPASISSLLTIVGRKKRNATAIFALNLLLGWTVLGWVAALVWAVTSDPPLPPALQSAAPLLSGSCGKHSAPGSQFCNSCGGKFISN
jgi:hypothetical protein